MTPDLCVDLNSLSVCGAARRRRIVMAVVERAGRRRVAAAESDIESHFIRRGINFYAHRCRFHDLNQILQARLRRRSAAFRAKISESRRPLPCVMIRRAAPRRAAPLWPVLLIPRRLCVSGDVCKRRVLLVSKNLDALGWRGAARDRCVTSRFGSTTGRARRPAASGGGRFGC